MTVITECFFDQKSKVIKEFEKSKFSKDFCQNLNFYLVDFWTSQATKDSLVNVRIVVAL